MDLILNIVAREQMFKVNETWIIIFKNFITLYNEKTAVNFFINKKV